MDTVLLIARLVLSAVFLVAGLAKLVDQTGSRQSIAAFGLPVGLSRPLAILLPLAEVAVAIALLPASWARMGALGALGLLLLFIAGICFNLARGRQPDCHCFGQLHSEPIGRSTLIRNGVLAALAGVILWVGWDDPGPSAIGWLSGLGFLESVVLGLGLVMLGLIVAGTWFVLTLLKERGELLLKVEELEARGPGVHRPKSGAASSGPVPGQPVGTPAPSFTLTNLRGEPFPMNALRTAGKPVMLVFVDPNCGPCDSLLPDVRRWQEEYAEKVVVALISQGGAKENSKKVKRHRVQLVLLQKEREVAEAYQAYGTPAAVVVQPDGTIGSPLVMGPESIRDLMNRTVRLPTPLPMAKRNGTATPPQTGPKPGEPAPALRLPDLDGNTIELASFRGMDTLLLFWGLDCGYCRRMLPELRAWEASRPGSAPQLLVVSSGSAEANREMGLQSPVVLDQDFGTGRAFGARGTPSAVLVDREGRIASEVVAGDAGVMRLAAAGGSTNVANA